MDTGGNWLRFYRAGETEESDTSFAVTGLARVVEVAARQGDTRGDDGQALAVLERGLARHLDAPPLERVRALLYRAELSVRLGQSKRATASMLEATQTALADDDAATAAPDFAHASLVVASPDCPP